MKRFSSVLSCSFVWMIFKLLLVLILHHHVQEEGPRPRGPMTTANAFSFSSSSSSSSIGQSRLHHPRENVNNKLNLNNCCWFNIRHHSNCRFHSCSSSSRRRTLRTTTTSTSSTTTTSSSSLYSQSGQGQGAGGVGAGREEHKQEINDQRNSSTSSTSTSSTITHSCLAGKRILVIGGSGRVGGSVVCQLVKHGAKVTVGGTKLESFQKSKSRWIQLLYSNDESYSISRMEV
jgi:Predicted nucleoside-diphosphate-sugar epimerases